MGDAENRSEEDGFYDLAKEFSVAENTSIDQEPDHQLKNHNLYTAVVKEENADNVSNELVTEYEAPQVARSEHTCSVCGKDFKSMKSLSGHMRCHPDRGWRGIQPPTVKNSSSSTISESRLQKMDDQNDSATTRESLASALRHLVSWPVKKSRLTHKIPSFLSSMKDEDIEAACNIVRLSHAVPLGREQGKIEQVLSHAVPLGREQGKIEQVGEESEVNSLDSKLEKPRIMGQASGIEFKSEATTEYRTTFMENGSFVSSASHICRTCNKSFSSHQALGGHRASHKKGPGEVYEISVADGVEDGVGYESLDAAHTKPLIENDVAKAEIVHRCKTCNKTFPSGQALGGHQRCHWSGGVGAGSGGVAGVEAPTTSVRLQEDQNRPRRQLLNFDLNEPPMAEES
ncbi:zinc finger protein ZAT9-like protein [Cinnamomum micranthum f. kanehirae]|uniref:Zinc finger protein ZAT9-like protein n=1 Tax=Cinnamomum micranthum f. kanehirae TaxID=337451 RepID=A0A443NEQ6_9MAGN|nr:zinc finger protein ZAT9-like protein [Cinnamomum micranthum f. kanehirae]